MIIDNVEISWVKLDPKNPDKGFGGKNEQFSLVASTTDAAKAAKFTQGGVKFKPVLDKNTMQPTGVFSANLKRKIFRDEKTNEIKTPPIRVVDKGMKPIVDVAKIGNGTKANVQVEFREYNVAGSQGVSVKLVAVQIIELKEFSPEAKLEFTAIDTDSGDIM